MIYTTNVILGSCTGILKFIRPIRTDVYLLSSARITTRRWKDWNSFVCYTFLHRYCSAFIQNISSQNRLTKTRGLCTGTVMFIRPSRPDVYLASRTRITTRRWNDWNLFVCYTFLPWCRDYNIATCLLHIFAQVLIAPRLFKTYHPKIDLPRQEGCVQGLWCL